MCFLEKSLESLCQLKALDFCYPTEQSLSHDTLKKAQHSWGPQELRCFSCHFFPLLFVTFISVAHCHCYWSLPLYSIIFSPNSTLLPFNFLHFPLLTPLFFGFIFSYPFLRWNGEFCSGIFCQTKIFFLLISKYH